MGGWDRISLLPDEILGLILSLIPTKDAVKTCTLSKRWKSEWTFVHAVQLVDLAFLLSRKDGFIDGVLNQVTCLRRLELRLSCSYDVSRLERFTTKLQELDFKFEANQLVKLPPSIFSSKKLVILKISKHVELKVPSVVWLPSLKLLHLYLCQWYIPWNDRKRKRINVSAVENIIACCPSLEELLLDVARPMRDSLKKKKRLCVKSSSLKRLILGSHWGTLRVEIDAGNLEELVLKFVMSERNLVLINSRLPLLTRVRIVHSNYYPAEEKDYCGNTLVELLSKVSNTKYFFFAFSGMMCPDHGEFYQQVPIFKNLVHLELRATPSRLPVLPCLLQNSPNLVSFTLGVIIKSSENMLHSTPNYSTMTMLHHHLEKVHLSFYEACDYEMELVTYFLKNAPVLEKIIVIFKSQIMEKKEASLIYNRIVQLPKASITCEVVAKFFDSYRNIIFP